MRLNNALALLVVFALCAVNQAEKGAGDGAPVADEAQGDTPNGDEVAHIDGGDGHSSEVPDSSSEAPEESVAPVETSSGSAAVEEPASVDSVSIVEASGTNSTEGSGFEGSGTDGSGTEESETVEAEIEESDESSTKETLWSSAPSVVAFRSLFPLLAAIVLP